MFFLIAVVLFVLGAVGWKSVPERVKLESFGLAFFVFPFFWNAWGRELIGTAIGPLPGPIWGELYSAA
jgi:hypothetical protein